MEIFKSLLILIGTVIGTIVAISLVYILLKIIYIAIITRSKRKSSLKRRWKHLKYMVLYGQFFNFADFLKWVVYDFFHGKDRFKMFGIWGFVGYYGSGKTLGACTLALQYQKKYPEKHISIYTNFNMVGQNGKINSWEDIIGLPKCTILIFDEIQSTFTSQKFKDFPIDLLWKLTQCRKSQLMVFASTPVYSRMAIQIRESVDYVVVCANVLKADRYFTYDFYKAPEYEQYHEDSIKLRLHRDFTNRFVATNKHYRAYNTTQIVDRIDITGQADVRVVKKNVTSIDRNSLLKEVNGLIQTAIKK